jgi:hypothetical protein
MAEASAQRRNRGLTLWAVALAGSLLVVPAGTACEGKPLKKGEVRVSVVAILASSTCDKIDAKLVCIAKEVQKVHPELKLTGFRMAKISCKPVSVGGSETFELALDQVASVTVLKGAGKDNTAQLKVTPPTWGEITYTVACGKFVPFVTGYQTKNGEWLILAVRVQPCNGKK